MIRLGVFVLVGAMALPNAIQTVAETGSVTTNDSAIIGGLIGLAIILAQLLGKAIDRWKPGGGGNGSNGGKELTRILTRLESDMVRLTETRTKIIETLERVERALLKMNDAIEAQTAIMAALQAAHKVTRETMHEHVDLLKEQLRRIERKIA